MSFTAFVTDTSLPETTFKSTSGMIDRSPLIEISNTNQVDVLNTIPVNAIQFLPDDLLTDQVRLFILHCSIVGFQITDMLAIQMIKVCHFSFDSASGG